MTRRMASVTFATVVLLGMREEMMAKCRVVGGSAADYGGALAGASDWWWALRMVIVRPARRVVAIRRPGVFHPPVVWGARAGRLPGRDRLAWEDSETIRRNENGVDFDLGVDGRAQKVGTFQLLDLADGRKVETVRMVAKAVTNEAKLTVYLITIVVWRATGCSSDYVGIRRVRGLPGAAGRRCRNSRGGHFSVRTSRRWGDRGRCPRLRRCRIGPVLVRRRRRGRRGRERRRAGWFC